MLGAKDLGLSMLHEFIGPTDSLDGSMDDFVVEKFDDGKAESIEEDVVFESTDDGRFCGLFGDCSGVERLDPTRIDQGDTVAF